MRFLKEYKPAALAIAPNVAWLATLAAGIMLLASGATPSAPDRFRWLTQFTPLSVIEISHFLSSILGLVLVLLAFGLRQRLDAAWAATVTLLLAAAALAILKGFNWEETMLLAALAVALSPFREAFPRQARLSRMDLTPGWLLSAAALALGSVVLGLWSFRNVDYSDELWWRVVADADASRTLRASAGVAILALAVGLWRLFATPATPKIAGDRDPDFERVRAILAKAEVMEPFSNLALLGDKRFMFSPSGETFLMFGVRGRSWIAMGGPVGRRDERLELLWRFREQADAHAARPGVYGVGPELLPDLVELGFAIQKIGESAAVPLDSFSIQGRKREVLRRNWRKAGEGGASFEVVSPDQVAPLMPTLRRISDDWLAHHSGGDKAFSMGGFSERYVAEFPCAVVRAGEEIVAFATLWTTPDRSAFSMDLMRYSDGAPKNIMDYLFVELLNWGREQGYVAFDFGGAPLAGLEDRPMAPLISRVGRLLFEHGEEFYNFRGVRRYKDKYDPLWQPRYIAAERKWAIPVLLADVGLLSSGGLGGLTRRSAKEAAPPAGQPAPA